MNPMQQMLVRAQKIQREMAKAQAALAEKEFVVEKGGMVKVTVMGDFSIAKIDIDKDALDADNKDMLEETIALALNEAMEQVQAEKDAIEEKVTGQTGGLF